MLQLIQYNTTEVEVDNFTSVESFLKSAKILQNYIHWIDLGDPNPSSVNEISQHFEIHQLVGQDILETQHLPKIEIDEQYLFIILKIIFWDDVKKATYKEQISIYLKDNLLITFQEKPFVDAFTNIKGRILSKKSNINKGKVDVLLLRMLSFIISDYNKVIIAIQNEIDLLEQQVLKNHNIDITKKILKLKSEILILKRYLFPTKEIIYDLKSVHDNWISKSSQIYLRDVEDHLLDALTNLDTLRESIKDVMDLKSTLTNQQMNNIMKALTIISVIFMPLTFITGFYGMNIDTLPAVHWQWILAVLIASMLLITGSMVFYMKVKKWL